MKRLVLWIWFIVLVVVMGGIAQSAELRGVVKDEATGEVLPGANVVISDIQGNPVGGAAADVDGAYRITQLPGGKFLVTCSYLGYAEKQQVVDLAEGEVKTLNFALKEMPLSTDVVVITAGRKAEKASESMANIQVIEPQVIQVRQEPTISGLLKTVEGVDYFETGLGQQQFQARGFYSPFTGNMLVLVDYRDMSLPGVGGNFGHAMGIVKDDIRQIEVIVGPNSALYGANASAGVVNIITNDPRRGARHSLTLSAGNRAQKELSLYSMNRIGKYFGYKIGLSRYQATDYESYVNAVTEQLTTADDPLRDNPDFNVNRSLVSGSFYVYPMPGIVLSYTGGYNTANFINQSNIGRLQVKDFRFWYHQFRANLENMPGLGSVFFQAYTTGDDAGNSFNLRTAKLLELNGLSPEAALEQAKFVDKPRRNAVELQHNFNITDNHSITWGVQWKGTQPNSEGTYLDDADEKIKISETGLYFQYEGRLFTHFKLNITGRYDKNDQFGSHFSPKLGLSYHYKTHNVRLVYNQAFNSPPIQPAFAHSFITTHPSGLDIWFRGAYRGFSLQNVRTGEIVDKIKPLEASTTESVELGYNGVIGGKLLINTTAYKTRYRNFISSPVVINDPANGIFALDQNGNPLLEITLSYINFGRVDMQGFDVGFQYVITPKLTAGINYSYAEINEFADVPTIISTVPQFNAPNRRWNGNIRFVDWLTSGTFAELTYRYVEGFFFQGARPLNTGFVPDYAVVDLALEVPLRNISFTNLALGVTVNNLLDRKHIELPGSPTLGRLYRAYIRISM